MYLGFLLAWWRAGTMTCLFTGQGLAYSWTVGRHGETSCFFQAALLPGRHNWQEQVCCRLSTVIIDFLRVSVSPLCTNCIIGSLFITLRKCILLAVATVACKSQSVLPVCVFVTGLAFVRSHSDRFISWFMFLLTRRYKVWVKCQKNPSI